MTQAEKMAEEYLDDYEWPSAPHNLAALIHQIAERTREEVCKKTPRGIDEDTGEIWETPYVLCRDIRNARWEEKKWQS